MKKPLTKQEILEETGLMPYQLNYLVDVGIVRAIRKGSGRKRIYPDNNTIEIINQWKKKGE